MALVPGALPAATKTMQRCGAFRAWLGMQMFNKGHRVLVRRSDRVREQKSPVA